MANKERADKWLDIVAEDLSVANDLYKTGHGLHVPSGHREDAQSLLVRVPR